MPDFFFYAAKSFSCLNYNRIKSSAKNAMAKGTSLKICIKILGFEQCNQYITYKKCIQKPGKHLR